jgi:hypothetical protein
VYPPYNRSGYEIRHQHVFDFDKRRAFKKKVQPTQKQQQIELDLPHTPHWDIPTMTDFQQKLNNMLKGVRVTHTCSRYIYLIKLN